MTERKTKTTRKSPPKARAAFNHFKLRRDPFTTLALPPRDLGCFVGRESLVDRVSAALLGLHNVGVAGESGVGKSTLLQKVRQGLPKDVHPVSIGVPVDDPAYFLSELLREMLLVLPPTKGVPAREWSRLLESERPSKNAVQSMVLKTLASSRKPVLVFVDDLEKIRGDRVAHWTRSERTLQVLEQLKTVLESPRAAFAVSLQEEFHAKVRDVVREGGDPTVLGLFKNIVKVEPFSREELEKVLSVRLSSAGFKAGVSAFLEAEARSLALSAAQGNPRRLLYLVSEAVDRAFLRRAPRVGFDDLFEVLNEHLKLDRVCRKLLFFLAKSGRAVAGNGDLQAFMALDTVSLNRRFETLVKSRLAERLDVADGSFVYGLVGSGQGVERPPRESELVRVERFKDENMYVLDPKDP